MSNFTNRKEYIDKLLAGQASAPLRGSRVNPCRASCPFIASDLKLRMRRW